MDSDQASVMAAEPLKYFFGQKFVQGDGSVTGSIVVMQHPSVRNPWPDTMNSFSELFKDMIILFINRLSLRHEFLLNNALTVKKQICMVLIFYFLIFVFFVCGELLMCHSKLCLLVSGSYSKIHVSSPVMTCLKLFFLSSTIRSRRSRHTFLRCSFCSLVRIFGTSLAQIFFMPSSKVKISWTVWRFKFNTLLIVLSNVDQT